MSIREACSNHYGCTHKRWLDNMELHNEPCIEMLWVLFIQSHTLSLFLYMNINKVQVPWIFVLVISRRKTFERRSHLSKQTNFIELTGIAVKFPFLIHNISLLFLRVPLSSVQVHKCVWEHSFASSVTIFGQKLYIYTLFFSIFSLATKIYARELEWDAQHEYHLQRTWVNVLLVKDEYQLGEISISWVTSKTMANKNCIAHSKTHPRQNEIEVTEIWLCKWCFSTFVQREKPYWKCNIDNLCPLGRKARTDILTPPTLQLNALVQ